MRDSYKYKAKQSICSDDVAGERISINDLGKSTLGVEDLKRVVARQI